MTTDDQIRDVRALTRAARITATTTRVDATHPLLPELAPGKRRYAQVAAAVPAQRQETPTTSSRRPRQAAPTTAVTRPARATRRVGNRAGHSTRGHA